MELKATNEMRVMRVTIQQEFYQRAFKPCGFDQARHASVDYDNSMVSLVPEVDYASVNDGSSRTLVASLIPQGELVCALQEGMQP